VLNGGTEKLTVAGNGVSTFTPTSEMASTPGFIVNQTTNQSFFKHLEVMKIEAVGGSSFATTKALQIYSIAGQTNIFIELTGHNGTMIRKVDSSTDQVDLRTDGLTVKDSNSAFVGSQLNLELSGDPASGSFINAVSSKRTEFKVDSGGNMLLGGAYISVLGGFGTFENHALYSEQTEQDTVWEQYGAGTTVTAGVYPAPDGTPGKAAEISSTNNPGGIKQVFSGLTAANNTFTVGFWGRRTADVATTLRCFFSDEAGGDKSSTVGVNLNGQENKWEYHRITHTFSAGATGSPVFHAEFQTSQTCYGAVYGVHMIEGDYVPGYAATQNYTIPKYIGGAMNGGLHIGGGKDPVTQIIHAGDDQGTENLLEIKDNTDVVQIEVDSNFTLKTKGRTKTIRVETDNYTLVVTDEVVGFNITVTKVATLPDPTANSGQVYSIFNKYTSTANLTFSRSIDGDSSLALTAGESVTIISDGTEYLMYE